MMANGAKMSTQSRIGIVSHDASMWRMLGTLDNQDAHGWADL